MSDVLKKLNWKNDVMKLLNENKTDLKPKLENQ